MTIISIKTLHNSIACLARTNVWQVKYVLCIKSVKLTGRVVSAQFFIKNFLGARELRVTINLHSRRDNQTPRPASTRLFCRKLPVSTSRGFCDLLIRSYLRRSVSFKSFDLLSLCVVYKYHQITNLSQNRKTDETTDFSESLTASVETSLIDEFNECHMQACPVRLKRGRDKWLHSN